MAISLSYLANSATGVSVTNSYTFSSVSFGTAATDRLLVVCINTDNGNGSTDSRASSITIGGISAVLLARGDYVSGGDRMDSEIWAAYVPTGTTGTVQVNLTGNAIGCGMAIYRLTGARITATQTPIQLGEADGSQNGSITVSTGGAAIGCSSYNGSNLGSDNITWTNLTEDAEHQQVNVARRGGYASTTSTGSISVTSACSGSVNKGTLAVAAFDPMPSLTAAAGTFGFTGVTLGLTRARKVVGTTGSFGFTGIAAGLTRGRKVVAGTGVFTPRQRTNLFRQSQTLDTTWTKVRATVSSDATTAPDGTSTADKLVEDSTASNTHQIQQAPVSPFFESGKTYTVSVYAKAAERTKIRFSFPSTPFGTATNCYFDLSAGTITNISAGLEGQAIEYVGNGWYRCSITDTCVSTSGSSDRAVVWLVNGSGTTTTYSGDGASGVYLWGAQCEEGTAPSAYIPTTTASVASTTEYASFIYNRRVTAAVGAFTFTGQAANLDIPRILTAGTGSFTLTGKDVTFPLSRKMPADKGTFTMDGVAASLKRSYTPLVASSGSFIFTGQTSDLLRARLLAAAKGTFTLTGQNAGLNRIYVLQSNTGTFVFTGFDAFLNKATEVNLAPATIEAVAKIMEVLTDVDLEIGVASIEIHVNAPNVDARPNTFTKVINSRSTDEVFIILVTIDHEGLEVPIRVSNDNLHVLSTGQRGVISNGDEYVYLPFNIVLPNLERDTLPSSKIVIDNIDRAITAALADITEPPEVRIQIALSSDPDIIDYDIQGFKLNTVTYDELQIEGTLSVEYFANEPFPAPRFTPSRFPGLFRGRGSSVGV